jgi:hypothetical protein
MSGGTPYQALTDIAGGDVGGGAQLCDIAMSQDESLVQFYPEVLSFAFFTTQNGNPMLPVPWTLLGARRYLSTITGETSAKPPFSSSCGLINITNWLNADIQAGTINTALGNGNADTQPVTIASAAFVAVASYCIDCHVDHTVCTPDLLVNNNCAFQRQHADVDIGLWATAYSASAYNAAVRSAFGQVVRTAGTGPWGAGAWLGDSQYYFLVVWLATATEAIGLDYYVYDHFCENPGNQCFVLAGEKCQQCIQSGDMAATLDAKRCGTKSLTDIIAAFAGKSAQQLYDALKAVGPPPSQVFDAIKLPM